MDYYQIIDVLKREVDNEQDERMIWRIVLCARALFPEHEERAAFEDYCNRRATALEEAYATWDDGWGGDWCYEDIDNWRDDMVIEAGE